MSLRLKLILVFALAVAVRLAFFANTGFIADDAFITFRYAHNIASGLGFVYNAGEHILGTSTPLFTWILASLVVLRIPVTVGAILFSFLCAGLTASVLYRFATYLRFGSLAWIPAIAYALWPRSVPADSCGMETALFGLLVISAFYFFHRRLQYYAVGCATLAVLVRPEGALLLIVILIGAIIRERQRWLSFVSTAAVLLIPWLVFAYFYFGSIVPHSITAKLALYSRFGTEPWFARIGFMLGWHNPAGWLLTLAAIVGGYWLYKKQDFGRAEIAWLMLMLAFFAVGRTHLFFWYPAPLNPILLLLAGAAVCLAFDHLPVMRSNPLWSRGLTILMGVVLLLALNLPMQSYRREQEYANSVLAPAGLYLNEVVKDMETEVAAEDIGYIGSCSGRKILDRDGLVSTAPVEYNREGRYLDLILDRRPDWVGVTIGSPISGFVDSLPFLDRYRADTAFMDSSGRGYTIYRKK